MIGRLGSSRELWATTDKLSAMQRRLAPIIEEPRPSPFKDLARSTEADITVLVDARAAERAAELQHREAVLAIMRAQLDAAQDEYVRAEAYRAEAAQDRAGARDDRALAAADHQAAADDRADARDDRRVLRRLQVAALVVTVAALVVTVAQLIA